MPSGADTGPIPDGGVGLASERLHTNLGITGKARGQTEGGKDMTTGDMIFVAFFAALGAIIGYVGGCIVVWLSD